MNGIAVIIPVYNGEKHIERCVKDLSSAGTRISEIIIVNDGSTDGSEATIEAVAKADHRIRPIHTENHGSYEARRTGVAAATAPYIAFLDVDDRHCDGALDRLAGLIEDHGADIAMGRYIETNSIEAPAAVKGAVSVREQSPEQIWPRIMKWGTQEFILYVWHKLYRREVLEGLIEGDGICQGDDVLITCQAFLKAKKTVETSATVYLYYQNPESMLHSGFGDRDLDLMRVWDKVVDLMPEGQLRYMARVNRWRTDYTLLTRLILANERTLDEQYRDEALQWRDSLREHWKDLVSILPMNRKALVLGLRFFYGPTKRLLRTVKRLVERR